jgi:hypothetical protein
MTLDDDDVLAAIVRVPQEEVTDEDIAAGQSPPRLPAVEPQAHRAPTAGTSDDDEHAPERHSPDEEEAGEEDAGDAYAGEGDDGSDDDFN